MLAFEHKLHQSFQRGPFWFLCNNNNNLLLRGKKGASNKYLSEIIASACFVCIEGCGCIANHTDFCMYRWKADSCIYLYQAHSKKITAAFSQRQEWCLNPAFWFKWQLVVCYFQLQIEIIFKVCGTTITFHFSINFPVNLGTCFSSFVYYVLGTI